MAEKTMTEKEMFIQAWESEFPTTIKLLKAYPAAQGDFKPHPRSRTARELAWTFVMEENVIDGCIKGQLPFGPGATPPPPSSMGEVIDAYERTHRDLVAKMRSVGDEELNRTMPFPVGPKKMGEVRKGQICWSMLMDAIHHRGQFSVYVRMAGAKVPSIYGPTADEPWM